jgi:putative selenium metabolism hydrolase
MEEDCDGLCWQYLLNVEKLKPELVVITEPTNMNIYRGHRGRMEIRVEVKGRSCHGSAPERGDNAIYKIARIALEIEKLNERLKGDPFLGKGTVTISEVKSSSPSLCAVADEAGIHLDRRLTYGETKASAIAEVKDAGKRAGYPDAKVYVLTVRRSGLHGQSLSDGKILSDLGARRRNPRISRTPSPLTPACSANNRSWTSGRSARTASPRWA